MVEESLSKEFLKDIWSASMKLMAKAPDIKSSEIIFLLEEWIRMLKQVAGTKSTLADDSPPPAA